VFWSKLQVITSKGKPSSIEVKPTMTAGDVSTKGATDVKPPQILKPVALTYEAYYTKLTQESELNKFKVC